MLFVCEVIGVCFLNFDAGELDDPSAESTFQSFIGHNSRVSAELFTALSTEVWMEKMVVADVRDFFLLRLLFLYLIKVR